MNPTVEIAKQLFKKQYGLLSLPPIGSPRFLSMINGTSELINVTLRSQGRSSKASSLSINFSNDSSASTDFDRNVKIPAWYCYLESLEEFVGEPLNSVDATAISLALVNGSGIHEALHVAHSGAIMTKSFERVLRGHPNPNLFSYLINIVEDLRIEYLLKNSRADALEKFIDCKNEIFFGKKRYNEVLEKSIKKYDGKPKDICLELLSFYKNEVRRSAFNDYLNENGLSEVVELLGQSMALKADTQDIAERLFKIFDESEASNAASEMQLIMQKLEKMAVKAMEKLLQDFPDEQLDLDVVDDEDYEKISPVREIDVLANPRKTMSTRYHKASSKLKFGFMKKLKVARQILPAMNEPKTRGTKLMNTRISRIITDGKMFTTHGDSMYSMQKRQPEFIILMDCSGSMSGLVENVNETVRNMSKAMIDANIPHAVYGHTSLGGTDPVVFHVYTYKTNGKTSGDHEKRFDDVYQIHLMENYDGFAIKHVSEKFNKRCEHKVLIVLSDGSPAGPAYNGSVGDEHTKSCIKWSRNHGIKVISMSLTSPVMRANDRIYGEEFNVDATSQQKLEEGMQRIIMGG